MRRIFHSRIPSTPQQLELAFGVEDYRERRARRRLAELDVIERYWVMVMTTAASVLAATGSITLAGAVAVPTYVAAGVRAAVRWATSRAPPRERLVVPELSDTTLSRDDPS
jgi:hypothetical protein